MLVIPKDTLVRCICPIIGKKKTVDFYLYLLADWLVLCVVSFGCYGTVLENDWA